MEEKKGITGSTLKLIAMFCMLIDHCGAVVLARYLGSLQQFNRPLWILYIVMRLIGRLAFPIFCFLLVEGFVYTHSRAKYVARLFLFALISEVPFDFAMQRTWLEFSYQNVFFTLAIGLLTIWGIDECKKRFCGEQLSPARLYMKKAFISLAGMLIGGAAAFLLATDYSWYGVITIILMYEYHDRSNILEMGIGCLVLSVCNPMEVPAFINLLFVRLYNGKRGWNLKYVFYIFYPLHLLVLGLICKYMGV